MLDQRGRLLRAALGFAGLQRPSYDRTLWALRIWLDSWAGIGRIAIGMARQGFDRQLTRYDERGWRATFYTTGMEHSPTSATQPLHDQTVAVPPLNDERTPSNSSNVLLDLIPLMPFGYQDLNQPEGLSMHTLSGLWQFKPTEDLAKAIAAELHSRRIFRDAFLTFRESDAELVLHGALKSTGYDGR